MEGVIRRLRLADGGSRRSLLPDSVAAATPAVEFSEATTSPRLLRPVRSVTGVAKTGHDERTLVQRVIDCGRPDRYVGMSSAHPLDALRRADQANKPYLLCPSFFQSVYRGDRSIGRSKEGNNDNYKPFVQIEWGFEEIFDRNESLGLTIEPDMRYARSRNEIEHSFGECEASAKNRGKYKFLARDSWRGHACEGRLDLDIS
jgi:hypothetical protein